MHWMANNKYGTVNLPYIEGSSSNTTMGLSVICNPGGEYALMIKHPSPSDFKKMELIIQYLKN